MIQVPNSNFDLIIEKQVVIINVGMSTDTGLPGPLFQDGSFKFIPIQEGKPGKETPTYRNLGLEAWVSYPDDYAHNDPEFTTMTFGDYEGKLRTANLSKLEKGDFLFFFASLSNERDRKLRQPTGLFLIGYFEIGAIFRGEVISTSKALRHNAHLLRRIDKGFAIWKGTSRSGLLDYAVPMNKRGVNKYLRTSKGAMLPWGSVDKSGRQRTNLEVINSATRSSRMILPEHRLDFWKLVTLRNPNLLIFKD